MGWSEFLHDNDLKFNDLLVFRYLKKNRFKVEIFGTSGCSKNINVNQPSPGRCNAVIDSGNAPKSSGSRKRKVCIEVLKKKGEKVMDFDNEQFVKVVKESKWQEDEGYIYSDGNSLINLYRMY